jgi:hypothetical protein
MIHKIFTVYDQKAAAYLPPFYMHRTEMALRVFSDCINSNDHQFGKHPADYSIFELGTFDDEKAITQTYTGPKLLGNGLEYLKQEINEEQRLLDLENTAKSIEKLTLEFDEDETPDYATTARKLKEAKYQ